MLETLRSVDLIACESVRRTRILLKRHGIKTPVTSYREENRKRMGSEISERILNGENVALVSDAGMPGVSDPGEDLVSLCIERGIEVVSLPGPNAALTALVVSGISTKRFAFEGFLPRKRSDRRRHLEEIEKDRRTLIFYESPRRIKEALSDMEEILGNRQVAVARELTKKFEEVLRGSISSVRGEVEKREIKGEVVIVLEGVKVERKEVFGASLDNAVLQVMKLKEEGLTLKEAVEAVSEECSLPKNKLYNLAIKRLR